MSEPHTPEVSPHIVKEIGHLMTVGTDWAGTLARQLHRAPPPGTPLGEETALAWAAGAARIPGWAFEPMARLLGTRAALLRNQAERRDALGQSMHGG